MGVLEVAEVYLDEWFDHDAVYTGVLELFELFEVFELLVLLLVGTLYVGLYVATMDDQVILEEPLFLEDVQVVELDEELLLFVEGGVEEDIEAGVTLVLVLLHVISDQEQFQVQGLFLLEFEDIAKEHIDNAITLLQLEYAVFTTLLPHCLLTGFACIQGCLVSEVLVAFLEDQQFLFEGTFEVHAVVEFVEVDVMVTFLLRLERGVQRGFVEPVYQIGEVVDPADESLGVIIDIQVGVGNLEIHDLVDQQRVVVYLGLGSH